MSILTYRYRIKEGREGSSTRRLIWQMAAGVNFVWNYCNATTAHAWKNNCKILSGFDLNKLVAGCSKELGLHSQTLQAVCEEHAIRRSQHKRSRLRWRSRKRSLAWIPFKASAIRMDPGGFTYCGHRFRLWLSRPIPDGAVIKGGSITMDARQRAYLNLQIEVQDAQASMDGDDLGLDLGIKDNLALSNGQKYSRTSLTSKYAKQLATAQRAGKSRQTKSLHAKIKNTRRDWSHKVTTEIMEAARFIAIGDVSASRLAKTRLAKSVYDSSWSQTRSFLGYKAIRLGKTTKDVNERGSTVTCSTCLNKTGPSGLSGLGVRKWVCEVCGSAHDRDTNAAINILREGLVAVSQFSSPPGHRRPSKHRSRRKAVPDV